MPCTEQTLLDDPMEEESSSQENPKREELHDLEERVDRAYQFEAYANRLSSSCNKFNRMLSCIQSASDSPAYQHGMKASSFHSAVEEQLEIAEVMLDVFVDQTNRFCEATLVQPETYTNGNLNGTLDL
jgi:hypothetical protein